MRDKILNVFPTPVLHIPKFISSDMCKDIVKYCHDNIDHFKPYGSFSGNSVSSYGFEKRVLNELSKKIKSCKGINDLVYNTVIEYTKQVGFKMVSNELGNSWMNIQYKNSVLYDHTHPLSSVSGALYIKADKDSSVLAFTNPNPYLQTTNVDHDNITGYVFNTVNFAPSAGDLILFPSWLKHGSAGATNMSDERIVLSFNAR